MKVANTFKDATLVIHYRASSCKDDCECNGDEMVIIPISSNLFPRFTRIKHETCPRLLERITKQKEKDISDIQQQLAALANDPNLIIITHQTIRWKALKDSLNFIV